MDAFQHLRLTPWDFCRTCLVWLCFLIVEALAHALPTAPRRFTYFLTACLPGVGLAWMNSSLRHPLSIGEITYAVMLMFLGRRIWRHLPLGGDRSEWKEAARRLLVLSFSIWAVFPLFTDCSVGGVDARWYANMLRDFVQQSRAGVFPVFLGQGEFAFNGAAHPFRSAPLYMWIGGVWDLLSVRSLSIYSIQHLVAITAGLSAGLGMYAALNLAVPGRRWIAAICAGIYILTPAVLAVLYCADMYMTFVACAALPWVFAGNARLLILGDRPAQLALAAGLALSWMGHPPTALIATLATIALQIGAFAYREDTLQQSLGRWLIVGTAFGFLSLYYFASMSELPARPGASMRGDLVWLIGFSCSLIGGACVLKRGYRLGWAAMVTGIVFFYASYPAWAVWGAFACLFVAVAWFIVFRFRVPLSPPGRVLVLLFAAVVAAYCSWLIASARGWARGSAPLATLRYYSEDWFRFFSTLSKDVALLWDFQLGWSVWLLAGGSLILGLYRRSESVVFGSVFSVLCLLVFRLPGCSEFFVGCAPTGLAGITSLPLVHRMFPGTAACAIVGGFLAVTSIGERRYRSVTAALLICAAGWSVFQAQRFVHRGLATTLSYSLSQRSLRSENSLIYRFAYDLLPIPDYFSYGKMDPRLETRILSKGLKVLVGPEEIARTMEKASVRDLVLETRVYEEQPEWLRIVPNLWVNPDDDLLLRFEFENDLSYNGYLIFQSTVGDYREYQLPESGMPAGFGSNARNSKVLSVWDSGAEPVLYEFSHFLKPGHSLAPGRIYARLHISPYVASRSPIRLLSLIPYKVAVSAPEGGFVESPRVYMRGYAAKVDDRSVDVLESSQRLAMVPVSAGQHIVEMEYVGTLRIWSGAVVSLVTWIALGLYVARSVGCWPARSSN